MENSHYSVQLTPDKAHIWKNARPLLGHLDIELTERCNNNCIHCCINLPANDNRSKKRELSTKEIKDILKEATSLGCLSVRFTGGEPLLRDDFEDLYIFARRLGLKVTIFTNATLITNHLAELFASIPSLEKIEITLYGMENNSYEQITRNPGSFEAAWNGINLLLTKKIPFVVKGALLPPNYEELQEFERWAATISWMNGRTPSYTKLFDLRCRRDSESKNRLIRKLRLSPDEVIKILTRNEEEYIKEMKEFCSKFLSPLSVKLFTCGAGIGSCCMDAYGYLQPCMMLRHKETIYDLKSGSLKEAMTIFFPKLREKEARNPDYLTQCVQCFIKGLCKQCPAKSWIEHGTLDTPVKYFCEVAHVQARYLGLLRENELAWSVNDGKERLFRFLNDVACSRF